MKHRLLVMGSVLILNLGLGGCTWDSSLYETYARNDSVTRCPPGDLLTDAEGKKYIDLSTAECYKGKIKFKSGVSNTYSLLKNGTDGEDAKWRCVDAEQNCADNVADCENCPAWIEDYRMCMAFQDFEGLFEKDNNTMPSIDFIADDRPTKNLRYHYAEAGKYRICPNDYNTCYYHKTNASERGQFGCVSDCPLSMIDAKTGKCQFLCSQNTCRIGNKCENQDQACGRDCVNCTTKSDDPNASGYKCNKHGACTVKTCQLGYHLKAVGDDQYKCELNTDALCGPVNAEAADCSIFDANDEIYRCHANGYCTVEKCKVGWHLKKGEKEDQYVCEKNEPTLCGAVDSVETSDCSEHAEIFSCHENGYCTVTKCDTGYHLKKGEKADQYKCEKNEDDLCGAVDSVETFDCSKAKHDTHASSYRCNDYGVCTVKVCKTRYHLKKSEDADDQYTCEENSPTACGAVDSVDIYSCYNVNNSANSKNCNDEGLCDCKMYSQASPYACYCYVNSSNTHYNVSYCSCLPKRLDNGEPYCMKQVWCGGVACHEQDGWLEGECYKHDNQFYCNATACQNGYVLNSGHCEKNTEEAL